MNRTKLEYTLAAVVFALLCLVGYEQYRKAIEVAKAEARAEMDKQQDAKLDASLKARDADYQRQLKAIEDKYAVLGRMTPSEVVKQVPIYIPQASAPVTIADANTKPNIGDAIVPQQDIKPIATAILDGEKCKLDLVKCSADLGDWQQKYKIQSDETAQWKRAAKGGSIWKRAGKAVLVFGIGAAIGYEVSRHH